MTRPKIKNGKAKIYYLDEETIQEIKTSAGLNEMSESSYLDFLIRREKLSQNPIAKLQEIQFRKEELQTKVKELEVKEKEAVENAGRLHEWQEAKRMKKPEAIAILKKRILRGDLEGTEEAAKTWQRMTGVPAMELIAEATKEIQKQGI